MCACFILAGPERGKRQDKRGTREGSEGEKGTKIFILVIDSYCLSACTATTVCVRERVGVRVCTVSGSAHVACVCMSFPLYDLRLLVGNHLSFRLIWSQLGRSNAS